MELPAQYIWSSLTPTTLSCAHKCVHHVESLAIMYVSQMQLGMVRLTVYFLTVKVQSQTTSHASTIEYLMGSPLMHMVLCRTQAVYTRTGS